MPLAQHAPGLMQYARNAYYYAAQNSNGIFCMHTAGTKRSGNRPARTTSVLSGIRIPRSRPISIAQQVSVQEEAGRYFKPTARATDIPASMAEIVASSLACRTKISSASVHACSSFRLYPRCRGQMRSLQTQSLHRGLSSSCVGASSACCCCGPCCHSRALSVCNKAAAETWQSMMKPPHPAKQYTCTCVEHYRHFDCIFKVSQGN